MDLTAFTKQLAQKRGLPLPPETVPQQEPPAVTPAPTAQAAPPEVTPQAAPEAPAQNQPQGSGIMDSMAWGLQKMADTPIAAINGASEAIYQTGAFISGLGGDATRPVTEFLQGAADTLQADSESRGVVPSIVDDMSQFVVGLVGAGKVLAPLKGTGLAARTSFESVRGASAAAVVMDPQMERLSNLIQNYEPLRNPVTAFLASSPDDSAAMGRLKNALEGVGLDVALVGSFALAAKALKLFRAGDSAGATKALSEMSDTEAAIKAETPPAASPEPMKATSGAVPASAEGIAPAKSEAAAIPLAPKTEVYRPQMVPEEVDVKALIEGYQTDTEALWKYGSREAAIEHGYKFAGANIQLQKIGGTDDVQNLMNRTAAVLKEQMDAVKGGDVLSDARVQRMVKDTADLYGEDPSVVMGIISRAGKESTRMVADMEAAFLLARKLFEDANRVAIKVHSGLLDEWGGNLASANAELLHRFQAAADMLASGNAMRSAAGRTLRRLSGKFSISEADIKALANVPPDKLAEVLASTGGDIKKLAEATKPSFWRRITDEASFLLTNNLLWNWTTHVVNTSTNLYMLGARPAEKMVGSLFQGASGSSIRAQAMREYAYTVTSVGDAWSSLVEAFLRGDSVLAPHQTEYFRAGYRVNVPPISWKGINDVWDLYYNGIVGMNFGKLSEAATKTAASTYRATVGAPTRALGALDEFVKQLRYRAVVQARASVAASGAKMTGADARRYIARELEKAFTADGRAVDVAALQEAKVTTFQQELLSGTIGKGLQDFRYNVPATALILPFIKTPINVLRYAWKMTPALNLLQKEYRSMLTGKMGMEAQAHAIGQMALGSLFMAQAANLALSGRLTGAGPTNPVLRKQLQASGWQPYSFVIDKEDGTKSYFPIDRFDPVGMPFSMVADLVDLMAIHPNTREAQTGMTAVGMALAKAFSNRTFLMNINQALQAATDPEAGGARVLGNLAGNLVPGSSALKNYASGDDFLRDARSMVDRAMSSLPGYSEGLPPQRDSFGEPIWKRRGFTTDTADDIVEAEHNRIVLETGYGISPPTPRRHGVDLREVTLENGRNAYDLLQELAASPKTGHATLKQALSKLIQSESYQKLVDGDPTLKGTKLGALSRVVSRYREAAFKLLLMQSPMLRKLIRQDQLDVKNALQTSREAKQNDMQSQDLKKMLSDMGYSVE